MNKSQANKTYSQGNGPICPYCRWEIEEYESCYMEKGEGIDECPNCEEKFKFIADFITEYYAFPIKEKS